MRIFDKEVTLPQVEVFFRGKRLVGVFFDHQIEYLLSEFQALHIKFRKLKKVTQGVLFAFWAILVQNFGDL